MNRLRFGRFGRPGGAARPLQTRPPLAAIAWRSLESTSSSLVPFGRLRGYLLCQHRLANGRSPLVLRELLPTLDLRHGRCHWRNGNQLCDLSHTRFDLGDPLSIKPWQQALIEVAAELLEMLHCSPPEPTEPLLPYTVAAFPATAAVLPRPTRAIETLAAQQEVAWPTAWQQLHAQRSVGLPDAPDGLQYYDTRLCDRIKAGSTWPGALAVFHDVRDVPMRHVWRPPLNAAVPESLFIHQPHAALDGWNATAAVMHCLAMESFPCPSMPQSLYTDQLAAAG